MASSTVVHEGVLRKPSKAMKGLSPRKVMRFYQLTQDGTLRYFKSKDDKSVLGEIHEIKSVYLFHDGSGNIGFHVETEQRKHTFYAENNDISLGWIEALKPFSKQTEADLVAEKQDTKSSDSGEMIAREETSDDGVVVQAPASGGESSGSSVSEPQHEQPTQSHDTQSASHQILSSIPDQIVVEPTQPHRPLISKPEPQSAISAPSESVKMVKSVGFRLQEDVVKRVRMRKRRQPRNPSELPDDVRKLIEESVEEVMASARPLEESVSTRSRVLPLQEVKEELSPQLPDEHHKHGDIVVENPSDDASQGGTEFSQRDVPVITMESGSSKQYCNCSVM